jgi:hypothetical protein
VVERKTGADVQIYEQTGAYGLADRDGKHALRADGMSAGAVRRARARVCEDGDRRAFLRGDSVTYVADMDARPRMLALFRNAQASPALACPLPARGRARVGGRTRSTTTPCAAGKMTEHHALLKLHGRPAP